MGRVTMEGCSEKKGGPWTTQFVRGSRETLVVVAGAGPLLAVGRLSLAAAGECWRWLALHRRDRRQAVDTQWPQTFPSRLSSRCGRARLMYVACIDSL